MTSIDEKIKQALNDEYQELISENDKIDANPFKQMSIGFKGRMGWMYIAVITFGFLITIMSAYSIYSFYHETGIKPLLGWGVTIIVTVLFTQITKMWYWMELGHNRVIREIKLSELQVAQIIKNQEK